MADWNTLASDDRVEKVAQSLREHGMNIEIVSTGEEAKKKIVELIPQHAEVMTMTSVTLESIGISKHINESGMYDAVHAKLASMDRATQGAEMQKLGTAPMWVVGSVHAISEDGKVFIASNTGSQLPAYAYGAEHVVWVVGTQKLVGTMDDAMKRIYEYTLPKESERAKKAYGVPGSAVNKLLIIEKEVRPNRITVILVKEELGF